MELKTLEDLGLLADLCRKKGIESIKITEEGMVEFKLAQREVTRRRRRHKETEIDTPDAYGEDAALFWSSTNIEGN